MRTARLLGIGLPLAVVLWLAPVATGAAAQTDETVERLLFEATQLEQDGDLEGALQKLELLSEQFPEAPATAEALLRLVLGNRRLERDMAAEEAARTLIRSHPRSPQAAGAYALLGQLQVDRAEDREDLEEARATLESAVLLFPRAAYPVQPWRAEAAVRGARVAQSLGRDAEAALSLADVLDLEPRSPWTAAARIELAGLLLDQGDWREAGDLLQEVVEVAGDGEAEGALTTLAANRLALIHRLGLRPAVGRDRWQEGRVVHGAPERLTSVAAGPEGQVAVTGAKGSTVVLDAGGAVVSRWNHEEAKRVSWHGTELAAATNEAAATFPGRRNLRFAAPPGAKKPTVRPLVAVERTPLGRWLVLAGKPPRVQLYEPGRRLHQKLVEGKSRQPVDLALDRRGRMLVLDQKTRTVTRYVEGETGGERLIGGGWDRAEALAVDPAGNVYVLDRGQRRIEVFDRDGKRLVAVGPALPGGLELERPADLTVDGAGRIWIADAKIGLLVLE